MAEQLLKHNTSVTSNNLLDDPHILYTVNQINQD